jgi:hypothetical protein
LTLGFSGGVMTLSKTTLCMEIISIQCSYA